LLSGETGRNEQAGGKNEAGKRFHLFGKKSTPAAVKETLEGANHPGNMPDSVIRIQERPGFGNGA